MNAETEMLIERRRVGRKLSLWRIIAVGLGLALLLALASSLDGSSDGFSHNQIARMHLIGIITDNAAQQKLLKKIAKSNKVKALVLRINSPGGTTTGGEALYLRIREVSKKKPVVAVFGTVAASAAYMAGIGADHIVTRGSTITGSVGVIVQWPDMSQMMEKLGVSMEELKSGRLKATPSPFRRDDPKNLEPMRELVQDTFVWFVGLVEERRKLKVKDIPGLKEGRVFTGRQAVKLGLADAIGGEDEAVAWLVKHRKIKKGLPVVEHEPSTENALSPFLGMAVALSRRLGLDMLADFIQMDSSLSAGHAQGLMSVWRPSLIN